MKKRYLLSCVLFSIFCLIACDGLFSGSKAQIQFEILEDNFDENQKENAKLVIQKRLQSLGARNIEITTTQKNIIANYEKGADSILTWQSFQTTGKLEFFKVCQEKNLIIDHFQKMDTIAESTSEISEKTNIENILDIINFNSGDFYLAYVTKENKARVEELLIDKEPVFIKSLGGKIKFSFGKPDEYQQGRLPLYAVFVSSTNEAPLDGSYITQSKAVTGYTENRYVIDLLMNKEGALIWEQLTDEVYREGGNIAIVIDNVVYSAPSVSNGKISGGRSQVSGNFTRDEATMMASIIGSGELPKLKIIKMGALKETSQSK
ncbi:hypothetical protein IMCC3317_16890 [Kordia antarctica]|uniref:SecDF P1 head subdomain domain-containing protein n=1 Tax=Kordia antarctica TaxID=1218801 RepID=A0A7L4ZIM5_9FLAO|nr:hypothetical protein [Kordia antarctica]QHI36327.1 hypothetical protein IMCC3317_16890 [Kordia antarctica]